MATMTTDGLDRLCLDMDELAELGDEALRPMLEAEGEVVLEAQRTAAVTDLAGPYNEGALAAGLRLGQYRRTTDGASIRVRFVGSQHGTRLAEIAFYNEFGTRRGHEARPFIRNANEKSASKAVDAAARVYDRYLKSKGF